jgi:hypothetical protein
MVSIEQRIVDLGGIASLGELVRGGAPRDWVLMFASYGRIARVREGWYTVHETDADVLEAWRLGGRLACASALAFYGFCARPARLHVAVPANASRLRRSDAVIHWCRRDPGGDRRAVSLAAAVRHASRCAGVQRL